MANILSIAQSALNAAQVGLNTTGHNIANANTPGYSRQVVQQASAGAQGFGFGFVGKGTQISSISRVYDDYLAGRVMTSQSSASELSNYYGQIQQIDNMLSDSTTGLSPALQDFFTGVQTLAADPSAPAARQTMLSSAQSLASQFQAMDGQLRDQAEGVNQEITTRVQNVNSYATQLAQLNDAIEKAQGANGDAPANDLLDQRDQVVSQLSQEVKVSIVKQNNSYNIFIGNGQPLVVGNQTYNLAATPSPTDPSQMEVSYQTNGKTVMLSESALSGGALGGLFDFRQNTLVPAQNALGRIATTLAMNFNAQHALGQDQNGNIGGNFFNVASPQVTASTDNKGNAALGASIVDANALTGSDYQVQWDATASQYRVTRLSDGTTSVTGLPATIDGVAFQTVSGTPQAGDTFVVRPTANGAGALRVAITDPKQIAAASPVRALTGSVVNGAVVNNNTGSGKIDSTTVTSTVMLPMSATLSYDASTGSLSGFPAGMPVTVTNNGTSNTFAAGTPVAYTSGATISFGGVSMVISGTPGNGDQFTLAPNTNGVGDNSNMLQLAALQSTNTVGGAMNYQGAFAQLVSTIGNKTHELEVTSTAANNLTTQLQTQQDSNSAVNLDEEATNLMRYQQAYAAAGKVMQTASKLFDVLLSIGT